MKIYDFHLPYYKQGDDLAWHLERCKKEGKPQQEALIRHAEQLEEAADLLRILSSRLEGKEVKINGDCHSISISLDEEIGDALCKEELLSYEALADEWTGEKYKDTEELELDEDDEEICCSDHLNSKR